MTWTTTWTTFPPPAIGFHTTKRQYSGQYPLISDEERTSLNNEVVKMYVGNLHLFLFSFCFSFVLGLIII